MTVDSTGMLCNLLLMLVIIIDPLKILHRGAWITILNLSLADFIACAINFNKLLLLQVDDGWKTLLPREKERNFFWMFATGASFMQLTLLTVQMYIIIKYPRKSRLWMTRKKLMLASTIVWVLAIGLGLSNIAYIWSDSYIYFFIGCTVVVVLVVAIQFVFKILIVVEILRSRKSIRNPATLRRKQNDVAKTVVLLNVILFVTVFPYFLARQIVAMELLSAFNRPELLVTKFHSYYYEPIYRLNFVVNPVLYFLRLQDYRRSLIALFKLDCRRRRYSNGGTLGIMMRWLK